MIITIIVFIFVLGLMILVHEFGHFLAARRAGIKVEEFAFGFPPTIYKKKIGETTYFINLIPIGGYVKLFGEDSNIEKENSYNSKTIWQRFLVIFAGVLMNFVLAWILFVIGYNIGMPSTTINPEKVKNAKIENQLIIGGTVKDSPAQRAGIAMGDIIIAVNGQKVDSPDKLSNITKSKRGQEINITITRYGKEKSFSVKLSNDLNAPLGIEYVQATKIKVGFFKSLWLAFLEVVNIIWIIIVAIINIFKAIFTAQGVGEKVTGPIGIWFLFRTAIKLGWIYVLQLTALISANLAVLNFFPFPALDGGRFIFLIIEWFRGGKKVNQKIEGIVHIVGFAILILLMLLITYRDVVRNLIK